MGQAFEKYRLMDTKNAILGSYKSRSILVHRLLQSLHRPAFLTKTTGIRMCVCAVRLCSEPASRCRCPVWGPRSAGFWTRTLRC